LKDESWTAILVSLTYMFLDWCLWYI
jgi:hypothetical protein